MSVRRRFRELDQRAGCSAATTSPAGLAGVWECQRPRQLGRAPWSCQPSSDVMESILLDRAGRRRSPATTSSFHRGVPPHHKGLRYPPDPPTVEAIAETDLDRDRGALLVRDGKGDKRREVG